MGYGGQGLAMVDVGLVWQQRDVQEGWLLFYLLEGLEVCVETGADH